MTDLTELDTDSLRKSLQPDVEGVDPIDLTVPELRYAIRILLDCHPNHSANLHTDHSGDLPDTRALRYNDLATAYEAVTGSPPDGTPSVTQLRYQLAGVLWGIEADAFNAATPFTRDILVALLIDLRDSA